MPWLTTEFVTFIYLPLEYDMVTQWSGHWTRDQDTSFILNTTSMLGYSTCKQYNLVPAKGRQCSAAGKVLGGPVENWQNVTTGFMTDVNCHLWADCPLHTRINSSPNTCRLLYWTTFTFKIWHLTPINIKHPLTDLIKQLFACCIALNSKLQLSIHRQHTNIHLHSINITLSPWYN